MSGVLTILIAAVLVVLMIVKRLAGQPVQVKRMILMPVILIAVGGYQLVKNGDALTGVMWISLVATGLVSLGVGAARGATIRLYERDGTLWQKYTPLTFLVWAGAFVARFAVRFAVSLLAGGSQLDPGMYRHLFDHSGSGGSAGTALMLTMVVTSGLGFLGETLVLGSRVLRAGVPLATSDQIRSARMSGGALGGALDGVVRGINARITAPTGIPAPGGADRAPTLSGRESDRPR